MSNTHDHAIREWFRSVDKDGTGQINCVELQAALAKGNLHFSLASVAHMIRMHDIDKSGRINYQEFCLLHQFLTQVQNTFTSHSRKSPGNGLTYAEVWTAQQAAGYKLDGPAFDAVCKCFDPLGVSLQHCVPATCVVALLIRVLVSLVYEVWDA
mmetsp:Transcript_6637/g.24626  ORF Transcript_6637/g.24626 Transcript_6637/m.24626 type:complete len:154 (-) Transcript_6637:627-1088(-)